MIFIKKLKFTLTSALLLGIVLPISLFSVPSEIFPVKIKWNTVKCAESSLAKPKRWLYTVKNKRRSKLELVLYPVKKEYYLGENILINFCLINRGKRSVSVNFGGDYRLSWREQRFKFYTLSEKGDTVPDPYPDQTCFGGLMLDFKIAPGDSFIHTIPVNDYSRITVPGKYVIYATHDLGWDSSYRSPIGKLEIELKLPDEKKAEELLNAMLLEKEFRGVLWGKAAPQHADFRSIRCPTYFSALERKSSEGNKKAMEGIGSLSTPEATLKIMDLLLGDDTTNTLQLTELLTDRMPFPYGGDTRYSDLAQRNWKITNGWKDEFTSYAYEISFKLFNSKNTRFREIAAYILQCVGDSNSISTIANEMTTEIQLSEKRDSTICLYPDPRTPLRELTRAAKVLMKKYKYIPMAGKSVGEDLIYILKLYADSTFRPDDWQQKYLGFFNQNITALTQAALEYMPLPVDEVFFPFIKKAMRSKDATAQLLSCKLVNDLNPQDFKEDILYVLQVATNNKVLQEAMNCTYKTNFRFEALKILTERLDKDITVAECIMDNLREHIVGGNGSFPGPKTLTEAKQLKTRWREFLQENEAKIRDGKYFHIGDKEITADLFPKTYRWYLENGEKWPN